MMCVWYKGRLTESYALTDAVHISTRRQLEIGSFLFFFLFYLQFLFFT